MRVDRVIGQLNGQLRRHAKVEEVARAIDGEPEEVLEAIEPSSAYRATSLETPLTIGDEAADTLGDSIGAIDDGFHRAEQRAT